MLYVLDKLICGVSVCVCEEREGVSQGVVEVYVSTTLWMHQVFWHA